MRNCHDKSGKTSTTTKVAPRLSIARLAQLQRILDMPGPRLLNRGWSDQVYARIPLGEQININSQTLQCFTWNILCHTFAAHADIRR
jgi:hypothetical protein